MTKKRIPMLGRAVALTLVTLACLTAGSCVSLGLPPRDNTVPSVDLTTLPDGEYQGTGEVTPPLGTVTVYRSLSVTVSVHRHQIRSVTISENRELGDRLAPLCQTIVAENRPDVDGLTGATWSSRALGKAVAAALQRATPKTQESKTKS